MHAYWRAANYLSVGQIYLLDNPLLREPLRLEHVKPRLLGPLGHHARAELPLRPHEPRHQGARPRGDLHHRPRPRRARARGQHLPRGDLQRRLPPHRPRRGRACGSCSASSPSRAASRATWRRRRRAPSTRAASWAMRSCTPTGRCSTTPICSRCASSATARRRPGRSRRAGTRTSSSTRRPTAPCCRSCTSTATRSPIRRCSPASRTTSCGRCSRATATRRASSRARTPTRCTS